MANFRRTVFFFLSTAVAEMSLMFFNASSTFSSINCIYPPTNKPYNQRKYDNCKPNYIEKLNPIPSVFPLLEPTFSSLGTLLPPLWAKDAAFICKLYLSSHTLWCVDVLHLFELCSAFKDQLRSTFVCGFYVFWEINLWVSLSFM